MDVLDVNNVQKGVIEQRPSGTHSKADSRTIAEDGVPDAGQMAGCN